MACRAPWLPLAVLTLSLPRLILLPAAAAGAARAGPRPLSFSWDTVPVFFETSNVTGPFDEAALHTIARGHVFVAEKAYDFPDSGRYAEDKIRAVGERLRALNPNISLVFYFNSNLDMSDYRLHAEMAAHAPHWWLRDAAGVPVVTHQDAGAGSRPPFPYKQLMVFNHSVPEVRAAWVADCVNMTTQPPFFDGCMVDRWTRTPKTTPPLPAAVIQEWSAARDQSEAVLIEAMAREGRYLFSGGSWNNQTDGASDPGFGHSLDVAGLQQAARDGKGFLASYTPMSTGAHFETQLAAFLAGCGEGMYFGAGSWTTDHTSREGVTWHPEYDRPLGAPLSVARELRPGVLFRQFAAGVNVTFDTRAKTGSIQWP